MNDRQRADHTDVKINVKKPSDDWIANFEIKATSALPALYANGNQQVQLTVNVEPYDGRTVTPTQLNSISLYSKNTDGSYQRLAINPVTEGDWAQQTERNPVYDYFEGVTTVAHATGREGLAKNDSERAVSSKVLYVTTLASGGSTITLVAGIDYDASTTLYSDVVPYTSTAVVTAHSSKLYDDPAEFSFIRTGEPANDRWTMTYRLRPATATVKLAAGTITPNGMIRWARNEPGNTFATIVGWVQVNTTAIRHEENITKHFDETTKDILQKEVPNASASDLLIFMQADNRFPYHYDSAVGYKGPLQVQGSDKQGNPVQLGIAFEGTERTSLTLQMMMN